MGQKSKQTPTVWTLKSTNDTSKSVHVKSLRVQDMSRTIRIGCPARPPGNNHSKHELTSELDHPKRRYLEVTWAPSMVLSLHLQSYLLRRYDWTLLAPTPNPFSPRRDPGPSYGVGPESSRSGPEPIPIPYTPCMTYMPTLTPQTTPIPYMEASGYGLVRDQSGLVHGAPHGETYRLSDGPLGRTVGRSDVGCRSV